MLMALLTAAVVLRVIEPSSMGSTYSPFSDSEVISGAAQSGVWTGSINISKNTVPDDGTDFQFSASAQVPATITPTGFQLEDGGSQPFANLKAPGTYTFSETPQNGYTLSLIDCTKVNGIASTITYGTNHSSFVAGDTSVTIGLVAGETVNCTFTNTRDTGTVVIIKDVPDTTTEATDFSFSDTLPTCNIGPLDDDTGSTSTPSTQTCLNVPTGSYTVTETNPAPVFSLTNLDCVSQNDPGTDT